MLWLFIFGMVGILENARAQGVCVLDVFLLRVVIRVEQRVCWLGVAFACSGDGGGFTGSYRLFTGCLRADNCT